MTENDVQADVTLDYSGGSYSSGGTYTSGTSMSGLDRFGRVLDQVWSQYNPTTRTSLNIDGYDYGYDFAGNVQTKANVMDAALSELYTYDGMKQLASAERGTLSFSGGQPTITPVTGGWP